MASPVFRQAFAVFNNAVPIDKAVSQTVINIIHLDLSHMHADLPSTACLRLPELKQLAVLFLPSEMCDDNIDKYVNQCKNLKSLYYL